MDVYESDIQRDLKKLFRESAPKAMDDESLLTVEDFSEDEKQEVEDYYRQKKAEKPYIRKKWQWSFAGIIILRVLTFLFFFGMLWAMFYVAIPFGINTSTTIWKSLTLATVATFIKIWWKNGGK